MSVEHDKAAIIATSSWPRAARLGAVWSVMSLVFIIPVAIITADRFLRFGGIWALAWGPPLVGIVAGLVHRDLRVALLAALGVIVFGGLAFVVMLILALQSLPGP